MFVSLCSGVLEKPLLPQMVVLGSMSIGGTIIGTESLPDALQIAMMGLGLQPGDEVITADFTFAATVEVIADNLDKQSQPCTSKEDLERPLANNGAERISLRAFSCEETIGPRIKD